MSMKFRLFASVAAPVLSLPLMLQPASAFTPGMAGDVAKPVSGVVQVQQQLLIPEGEQRERPRRERSEGEGGGERQQRREQRSQEDGGGERPQRRQQAEEQQQERPQRRQQAEERQQERQERREQAGERQQERQQRRQEAGERQQERQERREQAGERQQERQERREQAGERQQERQERREQAGERQQERQERREQAGERQQERQERREQAGERQPERQERRQQAEEQQQQRQKLREDRAREGNGGEQLRLRQAQDAERRENRERDQRRQIQDAEQNRERDPRRDPQQAEQPRDRRDRDQADTRPRREPPRTPEQVERAREVARDPSRARDGEQVVLPVENGAAVLDSAKERRPDRDRRDAERPRRDNDRQAEQRRERPRSDRDAQANDRVTQEERERWRERRREIAEQQGERLDRRPDFERPRGWDFRDGPRGGDRDDGRTFFSIDNRTFVRNNDSRRFYRDGRRPEYERLEGGRYREVVERSDGTRIVTVRNRYGEVVQRSRIVRGGDEYVLYYAPTLLEDRRDDYVWRDPGDDLPPMRLTVPVEEYIIDTSSEPDRDYYEFLEQPPVEHVERAYSLDEVRYSSRIRDKVPRIDLDTVTFATGSAEIPMNQAASLRKVADAINKVLDKDPSETFLIEGHTDAVGSDDSNLVLSDQRAESVANVLTDAFGIPPENLTTQGYGESYLKVQTEAANQENRRVTIRRITPLVKPVAQNQ